MEDKIIIDDPKLITLIINCMNKINQVMKSIEGNTDGYYVQDFKAYSFGSGQLPRRVECELKMDGLNKKQQEQLKPLLPYLSYYIPDGVGFFAFIKDFKKYASKITITEDNIVITAQLINYSIDRKDVITHKEDKLIIEDELCSFTITDQERLEQFLGHKGIMQLYIDIEGEDISINQVPDSESYLKLVISHKYLKGFSGTDVKADGKSDVTFKVFFTNLSDSDNLFLIRIIPNNKKFNVLTDICVIDS